MGIAIISGPFSVMAFKLVIEMKPYNAGEPRTETGYRQLNASEGQGKATSNTTGPALPPKFSLDIGLRYDNKFLAYCAGDHALAKTRTKEIAMKAQEYFRMPNALGVDIQFDIDTNIKHVNKDFRLDSKSAYDKIQEARKLTTSDERSSEDHDLTVYFSQDQVVSEVAGRAERVGLSEWKYQGALCMPQQDGWFPGAESIIVEVLGESDSWNDATKQTTAQTFAHEMGHTMGMDHDYVGGQEGNQPNMDSQGRNCLDVNGIMGCANRNKTTWSTCSAEAIKGYFSQLSKANLNCKGGNECFDICSSEYKSSGGGAYCGFGDNMICDKIKSHKNPCEQESIRLDDNMTYKKEHITQYCRKTCGLC